jgi:RND family efflux transporter MFP subunit
MHREVRDNMATTALNPDAAGVPRRVKAPLVGIVGGLAVVGALAFWTAVRIQSATAGQAEVAARRDAETKRTAALANAPLIVSVVRPQAETWQPSVEFEGTLAAAQSASLGFKAGGRIGVIRVRVGDVVKAGAVLGTLDATEAAAQLRAAQAQVRAAEAQLVLAEDAERRTSTMVSSGALAEASGVQTTQQRALAAAQLDAARAQVSLVQVSLANHTLTAPFAGTVTRVPEGIGAVVAPGAPQFELEDLRTLKLKSTISEHDANLVRPGSVVEIDSEHGAVKGTVSAVIGSVDAQTRRVPIEAVIDNPGALRAGSFVRARVRGAESISVLRLPHEALRPGAQDEVLALEGDRLVQKSIVFAVAKDGALLVRRGLGADEQIVLSPKSEWKTGDAATQAPPAPGRQP